MIHVGARSYKIARHKTIARAVWARALRLSELRMDQKCTPMPTKPTQMLLLVLHDSAALIAQPTLSFSEMNQVVVDQVIPLEAALDVPAAIVGRDPPSRSQMAVRPVVNTPRLPFFATVVVPSRTILSPAHFQRR